MRLLLSAGNSGRRAHLRASYGERLWL